MAELYGRKGEKLRSETGVMSSCGDAGAPQRHFGRKSLAFLQLPAGHDPADTEVNPRQERIGGKWNTTMLAAYGFAKDAPAHETFGGFIHHLRPRSGTPAFAAAAALPETAGGRGELSSSWELRPRTVERASSATSLPRTAASDASRATKSATQRNATAEGASRHGSRRSALSVASSAMLRWEVEHAVREALDMPP